MPVVLLAVAITAVLAVIARRSMEAGEAPYDAEDQSAGDTPMDFDEETTGDFGYAWRPSPNKSSRGGAKATTLVWHYTAGKTGRGAIDWLCNPDAKASAHFVIDRDGTITQLVSCADAAWHAGNNAINKTSIGVEVVNVGFVVPDGDGGWKAPDGSRWTPDGVQPVQASTRFPNGLVVTQYWVPYTAAQLRAMKELQAKLAFSGWRTVLRDQRGHEDIAEPYGRKQDPGPLFPWAQLASFDDTKQRVTKVV